MATQQDSIEYLTGGWQAGPHTRVILSAGGLGIDQDGDDGFQCKDLANTLGEVLDAPLPTGNAIVLAQKLAPGWSWVDDPQPGDLAIRNSILSGINYGDVLGITAVNGNTLTTIGQNQVNVSLTVGHVPTPGTHKIIEFIKFIRRNYEGDDMSTVDIGIARIFAFYIGGLDGEDGRANALTGAADADLIASHVGKETNADLDIWYNAPGSVNMREVVMPQVFTARDAAQSQVAQLQAQVTQLQGQLQGDGAAKVLATLQSALNDVETFVASTGTVSTK